MNKRGAPSRPARGLRSWLPPVFLLCLPFLYFWRGTIGDLLLAEGDGQIVFLPMRAIFGRQLAAGHLPLWNPWVFSGIPFLGAMQTGMLYPTTWLFAVLPPTWAMNLLVIAIYACTALCTYAYTRGVGCSRFASVFAAVTFAFCGFCVVRIGSIPLLQGVAWLPLLLLALDRLRHRVRFRFVALGSIAAALAILTGHPQVPAYSLMVAVLYAAFFTAAGPAVGRARYASIATACLAAGVLLTAVQLAPAAELAMRSVRSHMSFDEFTSFSLPRAQLPILAFPFLFGGAAGTPYWGGWSLAEVTGYVGILPIMLAAAALGRWRIDLHARFWTLLAALSLVLALGNGTPLAHLMYHVPIYSLFRGQARLLFVFSLAMAVLSAIALTHAASPRQSRWLPAAATSVGGGIIAVALLAGLAGRRIWGSFAAVNGWGGIPSPAFDRLLSFSSPALYAPAILAVAGAAALLALYRGARRTGIVAVAAVQAIDLLLFASWYPTTLPPAGSFLNEPAYLSFIRRSEPDPSTYRDVFAVAGGMDGISLKPALWGQPMINGYDSMPLARYCELAGGMHYWGVIPEPELVHHPTFLDLLNVKYLVLSLPAPGPWSVTYDHMLFSPDGLSTELRPGEAIDFPLSQPVGVTQVGAITYLADAAQISEGAPVAHLVLTDRDGRTETLLFRAGTDTSELTWDEARARGAARHERARVVDTFATAGTTGHTYLGVLRTEQPLAVTDVRLQYVAPRGRLGIAKLTLYDARSGGSYPLSLLQSVLNDQRRWKKRYESANTLVFENRLALPRSWLVGRTLALPAADILRAVREARLPGGARFDPRQVALVEDGDGENLAPLDPDARVDILRYGANGIDLASRSATPAFLVSSEIYYPGWVATVDGVPTPIARTDYALRGLRLPPGEHRIRFVYRPRSVAIGLAVSLLTALALIGAGAWRRLAAG